jgi:hypothetical protein
VVADLQAQGVARREADGHGAPGEQLIPHRGRVLGIQQQLDPVLARVARAAHQALVAGELPAGHREAGRQRRVGHGLDDLAGERALDGEHRVSVRDVLHLDVRPAGGVALQPGQVLGVVGRVGDGEVLLGAQAVGEEVVQDAPVLPAQHGVLGAADGDPLRRRWRAAAAAARPRRARRS